MIPNPKFIWCRPAGLVWGIVLAVALFPSLSLHAQDGRALPAGGKGRKIFIVCDSEGFSGCVEFWARNDATPHPRLSEYRELMMGDINAAVEGCLAGGATEVVVSDDGFGGVTTIPELIHPAAKLIRGPGFGTGRLPLLSGLDESFDGLIMLGLHPMEGAPGGCLDHTWSSKTGRRYWFNGKEAGELAAYAIVAGVDHNVPIIMVAGDEAACAEARDLLGSSIAAVAVKKGLSRERAILLAPKRARELIYAQAKLVVEHIGGAKPYKPALPLTVRLTFPNKEFADAHAKSRYLAVPDWPAKRVNDTTFEAVLADTKHINL